ncbi:hypothetical protein G997_04565 [Escherichia coli UMEA 3834-1]|nr:hypothetical protein G997_04565 [Escherichia coli UMEA 3834-1]
MLIIIMTRDRYLEYGLMRILSGYQVTTGRELFNAGKQRQSLPEDSYVILCDRNLERLTYSIGFAPIFPDTCYHLTHHWPTAADIPVASDNPAHYADAIRYNARTPLQGSLLPLTRLVWA